MIATGNHGDFDSLRVAPRPYGRNGGRLITAPTGAEEDGGRLIIAPTGAEEDGGRLIIAPTRHFLNPSRDDTTTAP